MHGIGQILSVCLSVGLSLRLSETPIAVFVQSLWNLKCSSHIWQRRVSPMANDTGSSKHACTSIYFMFSSLLGLRSIKIFLKSNISKTATDTTIWPMEAEYESVPDLSIGTISFDLGWPWIVLDVGQKIAHQISRTPWEIQWWTQWRSYRKPSICYRLAPWLLTLDDLELS